MTQRLRTNPTELDVYVTYVARAIGLPPAQVEKDFWITELVRAVAEWSARTRVPVIWKGGTTLSKVFNLIQRFSELCRHRHNSDYSARRVMPHGCQERCASHDSGIIRAA